MSTGGSRDKEDLLSDVAALYAEVYESIKIHYINNTGEINKSDRRTEQAFQNILGYTDNLFTAADQGNLDEAEEYYELLEEEMYRSVCEAARFRPEHRLQKVRKRRLPLDRLYRILLFTEAPELQTHREKCRHAEMLVEDAERLSNDRWKDCIEKCDTANTILDNLLEDTPKRRSVLIHLATLLGGIAALATISGIVGGFIPSEIPVF